MARRYVNPNMTTRPRSELEAILDDPAKLSAMFVNGRPRAEFGQFVAELTASAPDVEDRVREQVEAVVADLVRNGGGSTSGRVNLGPGVPSQRPNALRNPAAPGAQVDALFDKAGPNVAAALFSAVWHDGPQRDLREKLNVHNFGSTVPSEGGFLVPEVARAEIMSVALEAAIVRPRATVIPMGGARVPIPTTDATSNVSSVFGGVTAYWAEEASELTATSPKFGRVVLDAKKLTARADIPNELLQDGGAALQAYVMKAFPDAVTFEEDDAFLGGTGVGEPLGMLHEQNSALVTVAKRSGQAADTVVWENVVDMFARMLPGALGRAVWLASPDTIPEIMTMALAVGTAGGPIWIGPGQGADAPPVTILGRPLIFTEKVSKLGDAGDFAFVDPAYYLIGDRQAMTLVSSEHAKFTSDETVFRLTERVDGAPWIKSPITPRNGGPTLSPFVRLGERA